MERTGGGSTPDVDRLRDQGDAGFVVVAGDPGWDTARQAFNLAVDQRPELIAFPESVEQVQAVVAFVRERGLRVAPQRSGHAAEALGSLDGAVLLRTDRLRGVEVDPGARSARVAGGASWGEVVAAAAPHGLAPIAGSSPSVGVAGFHLGGGIGFLSRSLGIAANSLTAVELVAADGSRVRATANDEPELFWALRGGGGSFGIVTALELALYPVPDVYAGSLFFDVERASEVFHAWRELTLTAPERLTTDARVLQVPDVDGPPPHLRGRSFALVDAVLLGDEATGVELLAPLRALGPELDTAAVVGLEALASVHMDPEDPVPALDDHVLLGPLPPKAVDAFVAAVGPGSGSGLVSAELRQTGGALAREAPGAGALATLPGEYFAFGVGAIVAPDAAARLRADLDRMLAAMTPYRVGSYHNFSDRPVPTSTFFDPTVNARLAAIRDHWDPDRLLLPSHPVG